MQKCINRTNNGNRTLAQ